MKDRKNPYSAAELEVIRFTLDDIVTTSYPNIDEGGADMNPGGSGDDWSAAETW